MKPRPDLMSAIEGVCQNSHCSQMGDTRASHIKQMVDTKSQKSILKAL